MYKYDQYDQAMVDARVEEFRDQARRRLEGKLTEDQFKPLRLQTNYKPSLQALTNLLISLKVFLTKLTYLPSMLP